MSERWKWMYRWWEASPVLSIYDGRLVMAHYYIIWPPSRTIWGISDVISDCPCQINCPQGCTNCPNSICNSQGTAVLMLSTFQRSNKPMVIDFDGNLIISNRYFLFYYRKCKWWFGFWIWSKNRSLCWLWGNIDGRNVVFWRIWIVQFGTAGIHRQLSVSIIEKILSCIQLSKIEGCKLVRKGTLSFDFYKGSCNTFLEPVPQILLCFHNMDPKVCRTWVNGQVLVKKVLYSNWLWLVIQFRWREFRKC